jgi:hypothetical protein
MDANQDGLAAIDASFHGIHQLMIHVNHVVPNSVSDRVQILLEVLNVVLFVPQVG